ncbi:gliding motility-associated C-terminal domain-containing protein [Pontibacter sp. JH31]|uniref:Gliding motility-associated C-terminal domain-containing protein n=1 Tax=Pontibacter aquaedesilientis TaxID=2766980 RepID=A0ABR7XGE7_9BACT|nr:gliding motility-associated C-terminal domain-containing protein [Pontibacter aquaedesilientis]
MLLIGPVRAQTPNCPATITVTSPDRTVLCQGETTVLRASTGTGLTYEWLRNGTVIAGATGQTLEVSTAGNYQVRVSGSACQTNTSAETEITVNPRPNTPNFVATPTTAACSGTPLSFSVNAPQADVVYTWAFGDGGTARGATVTHAYNLRGTGLETFMVEVFGTSTVTGCESETVTRQVQVRPLPEISFTEENNFLTCLPDTVADADISVTAVITNTTQEPYLSDIRSYFVDWGDGSAPVQYRPSDFPISNPNPYAQVGDFTITISAVAGNGCTEAFTQVYSVSKEPKAGFSLNKERADENQQPPCVPVIVTPTDSATGGGLTYQWSVQPDMGYTLESGTLTDPAPVFRFTESGVYTIEQIVTNGCDSDTASQGIVVGWPQVQPPAGGVFCGPTTLDLSGFGGAGAPGGGGIFIDKNLGENITVKIAISGPRSETRTFNSDNFSYSFNFDRPGTYNITVEAVNECGSSNAIFQGQPQPPVQVVILQQPGQPTIQNPGIVCEGDTVRLAPTGPGPTYAWFDSNAPNATPIFVGPSFTTPQLPGGITTYYVAAQDSAQGVLCVGPRREVTVRVNPRVTNNLIEGDASRNVCRNGVLAELTGTRPSGGDQTTPYTYTWLRSTTGPNRGYAAAPGVNNNQNYTPTEPIATTTWFRRVVRSANCSPDSSNVVEVVAVDPVPPSANTVTPALQEICTGDSPAQLVGSQPTGGAGGPYTYRWEISTTGPNAGFVPAPAPNDGENYTISTNLTGDTWFRRIVTSGDCDSPSEAVRVRVFPALASNTITPAQQDVCTGTAPTPLTGSAPSGGNGTYTYEWQVSATGAAGSFTAAPGTNNQQSYTPGAITQTTYFQRVVKSGQCTPNISGSVVINVRPSITGNTISAPQEICSGTQPQPLTGSAPSGGSGAITFRWESSISGPTTGFNPAPGTNTGASYSPPVLTRNTWFRRVALSQGCDNASEAVLITILPLPAPPVLAVRDARACLGGSATLTVSNPNGNTIEWYDAPTGGSPLFVGPTFVTPELTRNTTYYAQAVNNSNCSSATRTAANVTIVTPVANAGEDVTIIQGQTTELRASGGATYAWEPAAGLSNPNVFNPVARPDVTTTYTVTVTTPDGCTATDEVTVTVIPAISVPNAFSPNGDRVNDVWELGNIENYPDARVEIFNRWGNQIFTSSGYGTPWDGTYKGEALPVATYYYIIYLNSSEKPISGHVTIIR